jgi:hypothetical protein
MAGMGCVRLSFRFWRRERRALDGWLEMCLVPLRGRRGVRFRGRRERVRSDLGMGWAIAFWSGEGEAAEFTVGIRMWLMRLKFDDVRSRVLRRRGRVVL